MAGVNKRKCCCTTWPPGSPCPVTAPPCADAVHPCAPATCTFGSPTIWRLAFSGVDFNCGSGNTNLPDRCGTGSRTFRIFSSSFSGIFDLAAYSACTWYYALQNQNVVDLQYTEDAVHGPWIAATDWMLLIQLVGGGGGLNAVPSLIAPCDVATVLANPATSAPYAVEFGEFGWSYPSCTSGGVTTRNCAVMSPSSSTNIDSPSGVSSICFSVSTHFATSGRHHGAGGTCTATSCP